MQTILAIIFLVSFTMPDGGKVGLAYLARPGGAALQLVDLSPDPMPYEQPNIETIELPTPARPDWQVMICGREMEVVLQWGEQAAALKYYLTREYPGCASAKRQALYFPIFSS